MSRLGRTLFTVVWILGAVLAVIGAIIAISSGAQNPAGTGLMLAGAFTFLAAIFVRTAFRDRHRTQ